MKGYWSDKIGHRNRRAWALLVGPGDSIRAFNGESIPGVVAVLGRHYVKKGKWSSNSYELELAPGVRLIAGHDGWETGTFVEGLGLPLGQRRWPDVANALGVSVPVCQKFLYQWRPMAAEALDQVEADLAAVDREAGDVEETVVSFGGPTNRQISEGYWEKPILVSGPEGETVEVRPGERGWDGPVCDDHRVRVLGSEHSAGIHGGFFSVRLAIPAGWKAQR